MLDHGGNIYSMAKKYARPIADCLDLSTGINPNSWTVPTDLPPSIWQQLPQDNDGLLSSAQRYYQCESLLAVAGSQAAIQALPYCRIKSRVGILSPAYAEHHHAWQQAGHTIVILDLTTIEQQIASLDVLIIINPNNPTGDTFSVKQLLNWHHQLAKKKAWLIVDEAFIDITPELSLSSICPQPGLIVLRSIGKFFGLAGLRVGFVLADNALLSQLKECLGPWPIATSSRYISQMALADSAWQVTTRQQLLAMERRLQKLLEHYHLFSTGCALFQWLQTDHAASIYHQLAQQGIHTRLFDSPSSIRFGLPKTEYDWNRLETALQQVKLS